MADLKLPKNICVTASDGKCYRYKVTCTPPDKVTVTHGKRWQSLKFWEKVPVTERVPLKMTEGWFWKEEYNNPEALKALAEQAHDLGVAHIAQYGEDFQEVTIDAAGAKFDGGPNIQSHNFSVVDPAYKGRAAKTSGEPYADEFINDVKKNYKKADVKASDLFRRFAGTGAVMPPRSSSSLPASPSHASTHGTVHSPSPSLTHPHSPADRSSSAHVSPLPSPRPASPPRPHSSVHSRSHTPSVHTDEEPELVDIHEHREHSPILEPVRAVSESPSEAASVDPRNLVQLKADELRKELDEFRRLAEDGLAPAADSPSS